MKQLKVSKGLFMLCILTISMSFLSGCGMLMQYRRNITLFEPMKEVSTIKSLELDVPVGKKKEVESFMIAFVAPSYEVTELAGSITLSDSIYQQYPMAGGAYKKADIAKKEYLELLRKTLQTDLDYILLQKGIRVLGTFKTHDEMTFDLKKRAIYTFTPTISIAIDEQKTTGTGSGYRENGTFAIRGYVTLLLRESITGEKLWVKRIEAQPVNKLFEFVAKFKEPSRAVEDIDMLFASGIEEKDNSDRVLADALSEFYISLGKKLWDHIDPEEWGKYLDQAMDIRRGKRY